MTAPMAFTHDDNADWFELANAALADLIESKWIFSADDPRPLVPRPPVDNWIGLVFLAASDKGRIAKVDPIPSRSKTRRGSLVWTWKKVVKHGTEDRTP